MDFLKQTQEYPALKYIIAVFILFFLLFEFSGLSDFQIFLFASENLFKGEDIYKVPYMPGHMFYYYSPFFAIFIYPLTLLPPDLAGWIWKILNFFLLFRIWYVIVWFLNPSFASDREKNIFTVLSFVAVHFLIYRNIHNHQMTILMLFCSLEGIRQIVKGNHWAGAVWLSLGINFKILPLVLLPYLIYRCWFKPVVYVAGISLALFFLPALFIGLEQNLFLHQSWLSTINPLDKEMSIDVEERGFHSLTTLVPTLLYHETGDTSGVTLARNLADLSLETVLLITNICRLALVVLTLYFLRTLPFRRLRSKERIFVELSYILMIIPLIFPRQQTYAFFMIFPAVTVTLYFFLSKAAAVPKHHYRILLGLFIMGLIVINLEFLVGHFRHYYWHFKTLTWGTILLVCVYFFVVKYWIHAAFVKEKKDTENRLYLKKTINTGS